MNLTLITALYNSETTLNKSMHSVLEQDFKESEYLLVDGASTDGSLDIVKQHSDKEPRIRWISEPDQGIYDALNKGIANATGDIIGFVHSDDRLASPHIISEIMEVFERENVDGVYGDLIYVTDKGKLLRKWKSCPFRSGLLRKGWMPPHPTLFLKKEVYEKWGLFDLEYRIAADYDFILRILQDDKLRFIYLPQVITEMRVGGASNRSLNNIIQKSREDYRALKANGISNPIGVLLAKNFSKIPQFFKS